MEEINEKTNRKSILKKLILILAPIALIYNSTLFWLYQRYAASDTYYSYGYFVPIVSAYLIWLKRRELKIDQKFSFLGLTIIILSLVIHSFNMLTGVFFLSGFSLLFLIAGIVMFLFGDEMAKQLIFPLSFLVFMFPMPLVVLNSISYFLKVLVTKSTMFTLKTIMHLPVIDERFQIVFAKGILTIDDSCSGLRSLIVIFALSTIFAYLLRTSKIKKITLCLLAIAIALFSNFIRVLLLSLGLYLYGTNAVKGLFHNLTGYLLFSIAVTALWLLWRAFQCKNPI